ncbi:hypothetical protein C7S18_14990 [Ahniella affigens]|uniref:Protein kinase domain-containing protein n=1 Tax=Ahniella affigens TaxID=2021234 RepID=A0A2P1PU93_9GAMM|nr:serine/threonine-protein kinase [Ahniella affigens]AVP98413.1 hypothetical protein C7S18_14990 [Ahniella affigens]
MKPEHVLVIRQALDLPASERVAYVQSACPGDPSAEVAILEAVALSELEVSRLAAAPTAEHGTSPQLSSLQPGLQVGAFRLVRELGAGGMGVVWLAERTDGFAQIVAIKWLHAGHRGLLQRFQRERTLLARLQHPHIGRILDGGDWNGVPWYAMEYVDGQTLDRFVQTEASTLRQRLDLILQICDAVQYAHQHLIVHRDLKPANVLVDGTGRVKLLDFGIAKVLDDTDQLTETRAPMTLAYAAPEQISGEAVTVATDVYALGGLLYELLAGQRPYRASSSVNLMHQIANTDPEPPSKAPGGGEAKTLPVTLVVPEDLDTITLKALARKPERRYASVALLADDLRRFRDGFPISARPDSSWYRLRLWLQRHRLAAALAGLVLMSILTGAIVSSVQAARARAEAERAQRAAKTAEVVGSAMRTLLAAAGPDQNGGVVLTVREALDLGSNNALSEVAAEPAVAAALRSTLARVYLDLGDFEQALALAKDADLEAASDVDRRALQVTMLEAHNALSDYPAARALVERIDADFRKLPANDPSRMDYLPARALFEQEGGDIKQARVLIDAWVAETRLLKPADPDALALALETASDIAMAEGRWSDAVQSGREARELLNGIKRSELRRARVDGMLGRALRENGDREGAAALLADSVAWHTKVLGADHPQTLTVRSELAIHFADTANLKAARDVYESILKDRIRTNGPKHPKVAVSYGQLALTEYNLADYAAAAAHFRKALEIFEAKLAPDHPYVQTTQGNLAGALSELGQADQALPILDQLIVHARATTLPTLAANLMTRGLALEQLHRQVEARNDFKEAMTIQEARFGSAMGLWPRTLYARAERHLGQTELARELLAPAVVNPEWEGAGCGPRCAVAHFEYARTLHELKRPLAEVLPLAERALAVRRERMGPEHALTREVADWIAQVRSDDRSRGRAE